MSLQENRSAYIEDMKSQMVGKVNSAPELPVDPKKTLLLVVDMVNDGISEKGFFAMGGTDISMQKTIKEPINRLVERCRKASLPVCYVQPIYDFDYLARPMREQFENAGLPDMVYKKGSWGAQFIEGLPEPDLWLVKSNFSSFSTYAFAFVPGANPAPEEYMKLPLEQDSALKASNKKTMHEYFQEAQDSEALLAGQSLDDIMKERVVSLNTYLKGKGIDTLIVTGASTHVCVDATISGAAERGYRVILPVDAIAAEEHDKHWVYLSNQSFFKGIATAADKIVF